MSVTKHIYNKAGTGLQNCLISAKGAVLLHQRFDRSLQSEYLDFLLESQHWEKKSFEAYQLSMLKKRIRFAQENVPYYQKLFHDIDFSWRDIKSIKDIKQIPLTPKSVIKKHPHMFLYRGKVQKKWIRGFTSGTSGTPMDLYYSRESFSKIWCFIYRLRYWAGIHNSLKPTRVQFTGREIIPDDSTKNVFWRHNYFDNAVLFSSVHINESNTPHYINQINRIQPDLIDGYPSAIFALAQYAKSLSLSPYSPKAIIVTAETLQPHQQRIIEEVFSCKTYNQYASSETSSFISTCEHGAMHINPEFGIVELLDDDNEEVKTGEEGRVVSTNFLNNEQCFIRYDIGDTAVKAIDKMCDCGRSMPLIEAVTGRRDDFIYTSERGMVGRLDPVYKGLEGILESQIIQTDLNNLKVLIVKESNWSPLAGEQLTKRLLNKVGQINIELIFVDHIPRGPNGKFRTVVSRCKHLYPSF